MSDDQPAAPDYEILGVSLFGPPPVGVVHLEWEPGVHVLYGKNGAGKTTVLEGVRAALKGSAAAVGEDQTADKQGEAFLHIRLTEAANPVDWDAETGTLVRDIVTGITDEFSEKRFQPWNESDFMTWGEWEDQVLSSSNPLDSIDAALRAPSEWTGQVLAAEMADEALVNLTLSLRAIDHGRWEVFASVTEQEFTPVLSAALQDPGSLENLGGNTEGWATRFLAHEKPAWVPIPVKRLGQVFSTHGPAVLWPEAGSPDDLTTRHIVTLGHTEYKRQEPYDEWVAYTADNLHDTASLLLRFFLDVGLLRVMEQPEEAWIQGHLIRWEFQDVTGSWVQIERTSAAQRRWISAAVQLAILRSELFGTSPVALVVDGPEEALHPQAVERLASGLAILSFLLQFDPDGRQRLADWLQQGLDQVNPDDLESTLEPLKRGGIVLLATHSPQLLSTPGFILHHVRRSIEGSTEIVRLEDELREDLVLMTEKLGLRIPDLLQLLRIFVVVEGRHDSEIIRALFGDDLTRLGVHLLHMSGTYHLLDVAGSELLLDMTDANLVVVLDQTDADGVPTVWTQAKQLAVDGDRKGANRMLHRYEIEHRGLGKEEQKAIEFCKNAISQGVPERITLIGLSKPDIIQYLDAEHFVPGSTWEKLWKECKQDQRGRARPKSFKTWLGARPDCQTKPTVGNLANLAKVDFADVIPQDLTNILEVCQRLAGI